MKHTDEPVAACRNLPTIFESLLLVDHRIAVGYCLGDDDRPPCPLFAWCRENTPGRDGNHDGTWAGVLFKNGRPIKVSRAQPRPVRIVRADAVRKLSA